MGNNEPSMLDALCRMVGFRQEHRALLLQYGSRLLLRRETLAKHLYWWVLKNQPDSVALADVPACVERLLRAVSVILSGDELAHARVSAFESVCQQGIEPSWCGGLSECFLQYLQIEITCLDEAQVVRDALAEALHKRVMLELMWFWQGRQGSAAQPVSARLYATLSGISLALMRPQEREPLFAAITRVCVEQGGFAYAWIGLVNSTGSAFELAAMAGDCASDFIPRMVSQIDLASQAPSARALACLAPQVVNDLVSELDLLPSAEVFARNSIRSLLSTPLVMHGQALGVLVLYAHERDFFDQDTAGLVQTMTSEICYALERQDALERSQKAESSLAYQVQHDPLTGLPNRQLMQQRIERWLALAREGGRVALLTLAIDGFHEINARLGHVMGDALLREAALRMSQVMPLSGTVGRVGAARFVIYSDGLQPLPSLVASLMAVMREPMQCMEEAVSLQCSIGLVEADAAGADATALLRCCDLALIRAREAGGGQCRVYDAAMDQEMQRLHALRRKFPTALSERELELFYQPKINLQDRRVSGVEALVRWRTADGCMAPGEFFPAIEHTDWMRELDWWVMEEALHHSSVWLAQGKLIPVSVNLSAMTLRHESFLPRIQALIMRHPIPDGHLELEVLESVSQQEAEEIIYKLERCREFGVSIALDDFGTGASSLVHLQQLPFDTIKIDQRFVRILLEAPGNEAIIRSMIAFAHYSGRKLVVEGVESQAIWDRLLEIGCSSGQGYAISPPVPAGQLMAWIAQHERKIPILKIA